MKNFEEIAGKLGKFGADFKTYYKSSLELGDEEMSVNTLTEYRNELDDRLCDIDDEEPSDFFSPEYEEWEDRKDRITDEIEEIELCIEELERAIDCLDSVRIGLEDRLCELESDEPSDFFSRQYEEWEERCNDIKSLIEDVDSCIDEIENG